MLKKVLCFLFLAVVMVTTIPKTVERGSCVYHTVKCTSYQCSTCNKVIPGKPGDHHGSTVLVRDGMCDYHTECEGCGKTIATGKDHSWVSKNCTEGVWCADCGEQNSRSEHKMKERLAGVYSRCVRCGYFVFSESSEPWIHVSLAVLYVLLLITVRIISSRFPGRTDREYSAGLGW